MLGSDWDDAALRAVDREAGAEPARRRAGRLPPIFSRGPLGSYWAAAALLVGSILCLQVVLYDLGLAWRTPEQDFSAVVIDAIPETGWIWLAFDGREESVRLPRETAPAIGSHVNVTEHSRYFAERVVSVSTASDPPSLLYAEPEGVTINGLIALLGTLGGAALALGQLSLARRQRRDREVWHERHSG